MNSQKFDEILKRRLKLIEKILSSKRKEYASGDDRLHNFKIAARIDNESPEKSLWGMAKKHLVCIIDMIREIENNSFNRDTAYIDEKLGDMQNYLVLLEALLKERISNKNLAK